MHVIIVGGGRAGTALAVQLDAEGEGVSVVDLNDRAREHLPEGFTGQFVHGNGINRLVLDEAGITTADALVALTSSDSLNIVLTRLARDVFHVPRVVGRLNDVDHSVLASDLRLEMVASVRMTADRVHRLLRHRPLDPDYTFGNGESVLVRASTPDYLEGRHASEFDVEGEIRVVEITRGGHSLIPGSATTLQAGDRLSFVVASASLERLRGFLGGRWD
ncbi:MAG: NAD-binding protein [Acidimicrobiales bacterium]